MEAGPSGSSSYFSFVPEPSQASASTSKKRGRPPKPKDGVNTEEAARKRAKVDASAAVSAPALVTSAPATAKKPGRVARVKLPRPAKVNVAAKAALKEKARIALLTHPKWKILPAAKLPKPKIRDARSRDTKFKPRLWTGDRAEYLSIFPEMTDKRSANGVSWHMYDYPTILLDETNMFWEPRKMDDLTLELSTTRTFVLPNHPIDGVDFGLSLSTMTLLPASQGDLKPSLESMATDTPAPNLSISSQPEATSGRSSAPVKSIKKPKPMTQASKPTTLLSKPSLHPDTLSSQGNINRSLGSSMGVDPATPGYAPSSQAKASSFKSSVPLKTIKPPKPNTLASKPAKNLPNARQRAKTPSTKQSKRRVDDERSNSSVMVVNPTITSNQPTSTQLEASSSQSSVSGMVMGVSKLLTDLSAHQHLKPRTASQSKSWVDDDHPNRNLDVDWSSVNDRTRTLVLPGNQSADINSSLTSMSISTEGQSDIGLSVKSLITVDPSNISDRPTSNQLQASSSVSAKAIGASKLTKTGARALKPVKDFSTRQHPKSRAAAQFKNETDDEHRNSSVAVIPSRPIEVPDFDSSRSTVALLPSSQGNVKAPLEWMAVDPPISKQPTISQPDISSSQSSASASVKAAKASKSITRTSKPAKDPPQPRQHPKSRAAALNKSAPWAEHRDSTSMVVDLEFLSPLSVLSSSSANLPNLTDSLSTSKKPLADLAEVKLLLLDPNALKHGASFDKLVNILTQGILADDNEQVDNIIDILPPNTLSALLPCLAKRLKVDLRGIRGLDLGLGALQPNQEVLKHLMLAMEKKKGTLKPEIQLNEREISQSVAHSASLLTMTLLKAGQSDGKSSTEVLMAVDPPASSLPISSRPSTPSTQWPASSPTAAEAPNHSNQTSKPLKALPKRGQHTKGRGGKRPNHATADKRYNMDVDPKPSAASRSSVSLTTHSNQSNLVVSSSTSRQCEPLSTPHSDFETSTSTDPLYDVGVLLSSPDVMKDQARIDKLVIIIANAISARDGQLANGIIGKLPPNAFSELLPLIRLALKVDIDLRALQQNQNALLLLIQIMEKRNGKKKATLEPEIQWQRKEMAYVVGQEEVQEQQDRKLMPPPPIPKRPHTLATRKPSAKRKFDQEYPDYQSKMTVMPVETIIPGPLARPEDPLGSVLPANPIITIPDSYKDPNIPNPIPAEIQAIIDAYIFGKPLSVVMSSTRVYEHYGLLLPKEYGCIWMGFFRILGVEEIRLDIDDIASIITKGPSTGHVRWRFRLQWSPGGENVLWPNDLKMLERPWWVLPATKDVVRDTRSISKLVPPLPSSPPEPEDEFNTPYRYRSLRTQYPEYQWRHHPLNDLYFYLFPQHLLVTFNPYLSDGNFPRGWVCLACQRINFQKAIRHRKCTGPACKDSEIMRYKLSLFIMRDPQDRLTPGLPFNSYPRQGVKIKQAKWADGTQTFSCLIPADVPNAKISMKHIFLGNLPRLQAQANTWLDSIQLNLSVERNFGDNGPFFSYHAKCTDRKADPHIAKWPKVPDCVNEMKTVMIERAKWFAEMNDDEIRVDQLEILAWVTSGQKKHPTLIRGKKKAVVFLALGCNIGITVVPRSLKGVSPSHSKNTVALFDERDDNGEDATGWIDKDQIEELVDENDVQGQMSSSFTKKKITAAAAKKDPLSMTFTMVHGDTLVFWGDDFEYSIKRNGTSFLLMGSCADVE